MKGDKVSGGFTYNEIRRIRRVNVGQLDDGRYAFPVRAGFTEEMAQAVFDSWTDGLVMEEQTVVDWCPHNADYQYRHGCGDWCERPVPELVWTARLQEKSA